MSGQGGNYDPNDVRRAPSNSSSRYDLDRSETNSSTQPLIQPDYRRDPVPTLSHSATFYPSGDDDFYGNPFGSPYGGDWTEEPQDYTEDVQPRQHVESEPRQSARYYDEQIGGWVTGPSPSSAPPPLVSPPPPLPPAFSPPENLPKTVTVWDENQGGWVTISAPAPLPSNPVAPSYTPPVPGPQIASSRVWDDALQGWVQQPAQTNTSQYQNTSYSHRQSSVPVSGSTPPLASTSHGVYSPPYNPPQYNPPRTASYSTVSSFSSSAPYVTPPVPTANTLPNIPSSVQYAPSVVSSDSSRRQSTVSLAAPPQLPPTAPFADTNDHSHTPTSSYENTPAVTSSHVSMTGPVFVPTPPPAVPVTSRLPSLILPPPLPSNETDITENAPPRVPSPETPVEGGIRLSNMNQTVKLTGPAIAEPLKPALKSSTGSKLGRSGSRVGFLGASKDGPRRSRTSAGFMTSLNEDEVVDTSYDPHGKRYGPEGQKSQKDDGLVYDDAKSGWVPSKMIHRATTAVRKNGSSLARSMSTRFAYGQLSGGGDDDFHLRRSRRLKDEQKAEEEGYGVVDFTDFEEEMPAQAIQAMKDNQGNSEFAYTATGEILDLSSLQGYLLGGDGEDDNTDESQPLTRATTGMQAEEQSYYFPEDPDMPNWKPVTMRPVYLTILQLLSLSIIGICEYLLQYSVEKGKRHNRSPYLTTFTNIDHMPLLNFALWKYLPTVVAVIFGVLVQLTDAEVKRVEPYFQLSRRPKGATAANSLNVEYLTFMAVLCPIQAIKHRHWAIFISSIAAVLSFAAVPPLQSVFLDLNPDKSVRMKHPDIEKEIVVHQIWTRLLEAVYFLIFALIGVLQVMIFRRKTGLVGDPSGIAGVAAMACKSHILMDFKGLDQADTEEIHQALKKRTYILHKSSLWQGKFLKESERPQKNVKRQNPHPLFFRFVGAIPLMLYLIGMMVFIPVFLYNKNRGLQVLQNSPWFITALSVSIKMLWEVIDRDLRILQPFFMLYNRHAHSDVLTLDYTATIPGWIIYKTAKNKHYLLTFITTITLLNEVLTVCMGSLGQGGDAGGEESSMSTKISLALSELIIFTQIIGICILLYLRRKPFLPRQPGTISSVLAYIYQSHMLKDFSGMEKATTDKRRKMLAALEPKRTYGFGWFKGLIDGQWHLGIDQEELRRGYKHGESFTDGVLQSVPTNIDVY